MLEDNHKPPSNTNIKNAWSSIATPPYTFMQSIHIYTQGKICLLFTRVRKIAKSDY